jgi:cytochrome c peroxidase
LAGELAGAADSSEKIDAYRQFAHEHQGSAKLGEQRLLTERKLACANCHHITGG